MKPTAPVNVVYLADRSPVGFVEIMEVEPLPAGKFAGKVIDRDGNISSNPKATLWKHQTFRLPATIHHVYLLVRETLRSRNVCWILGAHADPENWPITRKWKAFINNRGSHGVIDKPNRLYTKDIDGAIISWFGSPERAVKAVVEMLGEPFSKASYVWILTSSHGLETIGGKGQKRWTGKIIDGELRVRLIFILDRALNESERLALNDIAQSRVKFKIDPAPCRIVQPNYLLRPKWEGHPGQDPLGDIPVLGMVKGEQEYLIVPPNLKYKAKIAKAQGTQSSIPSHPSAEAAVRSIGAGGDVRAHMRRAVHFLVDANPIPPSVDVADYSRNIAYKLLSMVEEHKDAICENLARFPGHDWNYVLTEYFPKNMTDYAVWALNVKVSNRRTIKLSKKDRTAASTVTLEETRAFVASIVKRFFKGETEPHILLVSHTGSGKSTQFIEQAIQYIKENPKKTVLILVPRLDLSDELVKNLMKLVNPESGITAAVYRGRGAPNPHGSKEGETMCQRLEEVEEVQKVLLDVEKSLCKRSVPGKGGRTKNATKCPFLRDGTCAYWNQKDVKADIWFAAHEILLSEMPKCFGDVGRLIIDESPLDAFFNEPVELKLDTLNTPLPLNPENYDDFDSWFQPLTGALKEIYKTLDKIKVLDDPHHGVPVPRESLNPFCGVTYFNSNNELKQFSLFSPTMMNRWRGKIEPKIRPDMTKKEVLEKVNEARINQTIKKIATLWELINSAPNDELYGRIKVCRGEEGRYIHMVNTHELAAEWSRIRTLICDATGEVDLLKFFWPLLEEKKVAGLMTQPENVRVFQCVDRAFSMSAIAIEGKDKDERERKKRTVAGVFAAVLMKALEYGGAEVGLITYKTTQDWIERNCVMPPWLKIAHWGGLTGTNKMQNVRALIVVGRLLPSAEEMTEQAEAMAGAYIPERGYVDKEKGGEIQIHPDPDGNDTVEVNVWEHPNPLAERLRKHVTEGGIVQAVGRARAAMRGKETPLDVYLWTNIPVHEIGPVHITLWDDLNVGLDALMLACGGVWLENRADAVRAYGPTGTVAKLGLTIDGLETARANAPANPQYEDRSIRPISPTAVHGLDQRSTGFPYNILPIGKTGTPLMSVLYKRAVAGCKNTLAAFLEGAAPAADPHAWLEAALGAIAECRVLDAAEEVVEAPEEPVVEVVEEPVEEVVEPATPSPTPVTVPNGAPPKAPVEVEEELQVSEWFVAEIRKAGLAFRLVG